MKTRSVDIEVTGENDTLPSLRLRRCNITAISLAVLAPLAVLTSAHGSGQPKGVHDRVASAQICPRLH